MSKKSFLTLLIPFLLVSFLSCANNEREPSDTVQTVELPDEGIEIENAWARPGSENGVSALYMSVLNGSSEADTLISISSPAAGRVEVHESYEGEDGMMGMREVEEIIAPPRDLLALKPGGLHVMLMQLNQELKEGDEIEFTIEFANAGEMTVKAAVQSMN